MIVFDLCSLLLESNTFFYPLFEYFTRVFDVLKASAIQLAVVRRRFFANLVLVSVLPGL